MKKKIAGTAFKAMFLCIAVTLTAIVAAAATSNAPAETLAEIARASIALGTVFGAAGTFIEERSLFSGRK